MKNRIDKELLEIKMLRLGFREVTSGTDMLRFAVEQYEQGMSITKELYPMVARRFGSTPSRVERCMRHAIETAFDRGDPGTIDVCFGWSVCPNRGTPTVSEFVGRMARVCAVED